MLGLDRSKSLSAVLVLAAAGTVVLHLTLIPRYFPDRLLRLLPALFAGWGTFTLVFYVVGRLVTPPAGLPNMRTIDYGAGLVVLSLLLSGLLFGIGFSIRSVTELHLALAPGLYVGLALVGWGFGRRTAVTNRIASGSA
ncbi:hypothetical protein [Halorientalis halophila]|uniref:hypothetical protein n=1 Tax=Halorientalis halophila TaxID=3108499 RepID=UPI0030081A00